MSVNFYNTTHETGQTLDLFERRAADQETAIAAFFVRHRERDFTPSEVWSRLYDGTIPLTSVRRALSNLTRRGVLYKTDRKRPGPYNHNEHAWKLRHDPESMAA